MGIEYAFAGSVILPGGGGGQFSVPVQSFRERSFSTVIPQQYDFSCGSAAVASLLTYHYVQAVSEQDVFLAMYRRGDKEKIQKEGFSLLDMKNYLQEQGFEADGYRVPLDTLADTGIPAIVLIDTNGYLHFVLLKGINSKQVFLDDPAKGLTVVDRAEFENDMCKNKIVFIVRNKTEIGKKYFNHKPSWQLHAKAPLGTALSHTSLATFTVLLPPRSDF